MHESPPGGLIFLLIPVGLLVAKFSRRLFLGPRGLLRVIPSTRPPVRPQRFYFSHLQRHRHKGTATKAPPQRAPPTKIPQTIFRQESFVSLDRSNTLVNHGDAYTIVIVT